MSNGFFYILEMFRWIRGTFWTTVLYNTLWAYPRKNTTTRFICSCVMRFDSIFIFFHITKGIFNPTKTQFNLLLRNYIHQPFFIPLVTGKITWKKSNRFHPLTLYHSYLSYQRGHCTLSQMYYKSLLDFHKLGREEIHVHVVLTPLKFAFHRHARHWMCPHPSGSEPCPVDTAVPGISVTAAVKRRTGEMAPLFGVTGPCFCIMTENVKINLEELI